MLICLSMIIEEFLSIDPIYHCENLIGYGTILIVYEIIHSFSLVKLEFIAIKF